MVREFATYSLSVTEDSKAGISLVASSVAASCSIHYVACDAGKGISYSQSNVKSRHPRP